MCVLQLVAVQAGYGQGWSGLVCACGALALSLRCCCVVLPMLLLCASDVVARCAQRGGELRLDLSAKKRRRKR